MGNDAKTNTAFDMIQRDIMNGTHVPGQPLRIATLSARYGVSAATVRQALTRLAKMALIVPTLNRSWQVAPVSLIEFQDLLRAREALEIALLNDAIAVGTLEWESNLVAAHYRLAQAVQPVGAADTLAYRQTWIAVHDGFHIALLAGARSTWLKQFHAQIMGQLQRHHQAVMSQFHTITEELEPVSAQTYSVTRHTELMIAALDRDAAAAKAAIIEHNSVAETIFRRFFGTHTPPS